MPAKYTVAITSESFYPLLSGVAVMTERLARYLAAQGHTVVVLTPSKDRKARQEKRDGYTVYRIPSWPLLVRKNYRITMFPYRAINRILKKVQPDLVHIHDPALTSLAATQYARRVGIPVIVTHHFTFAFLESYVPPVITDALRIAINTLYNNCDLLTVPTETMRQEVLSAGSVKIPVRVQSNGVDAKRFAVLPDPAPLRSAYSIPDDRPILGYLGRLDPEKNLGVLLEAVALLQKTERFHLVLVGSGHDQKVLAKQAEELGIQCVSWLPRIEHENEDLLRLFALLDVFCIPSTIETESIVTMEAMAAGLPIVAAARRALPELVDENENGFLLEPDDVQGWARQLRLLIRDEALRHRFGAHSKARVAGRTVEAAMDSFIELYAQELRAKEAGKRRPNILERITKRRSRS